MRPTGLAIGSRLPTICGVRRDDWPAHDTALTVRRVEIFVRFGSQAAVQCSRKCVRCSIKNGQTASEFPELEVKRTKFAMRRSATCSQERHFGNLTWLDAYRPRRTKRATVVQPRRRPKAINRPPWTYIHAGHRNSRSTRGGGSVTEQRDQRRLVAILAASLHCHTTLARNCFMKLRGIDRFGHEVVHSCREIYFAVSRHRLRGDCNNGNCRPISALLAD